MNNKENFKDKFLELMSQQVSLKDTKDQTSNSTEPEQIDNKVSLPNGDIQEILKQKLKEKLQEKNTIPTSKEMILPVFEEETQKPKEEAEKTEQEVGKPEQEAGKPKEQTQKAEDIKLNVHKLDHEKHIVNDIAIENVERESLKELSNEVYRAALKNKTVLRKESLMEELAVFSKDTIIMGSVQTKGHLDIHGSIQGNVEAVGNVNVFGNITGNVSAFGMVHVQDEGKIKGNLTAEQLVIDGIINGDVKAEKEVQLFKNAMIKGTLVANDLNMCQGAKLTGMVRVGENEQI